MTLTERGGIVIVVALWGWMIVALFLGGWVDDRIEVTGEQSGAFVSSWHCNAEDEVVVSNGRCLHVDELIGE